MTQVQAETISMTLLDTPTRALVRAAAAITAGGDRIVRSTIEIAGRDSDPVWMEELILQSYLFAGFPRALNAAREWRRVAPVAAPDADEGEDYSMVDEWRSRGEETCAVIYGETYEDLRRNIRVLHPALDSWMVVDGYGKILARPQLDLPRRELCIVAACTAAGQDRQLLSHMRGALNAGVPASDVSECIELVSDLVGPELTARARSLWPKVKRN
jgi:4-carboxymuconolactone decarboxylase